MMTVTDRGIRCPKRGHEHFNKPPESERSAHPAKMCLCSTVHRSVKPDSRSPYQSLTSRQDALQTTFSVFRDIFYPANCGQYCGKWIFLTPTPVKASYFRAIVIREEHAGT
jgi:hypothetical protein